MTKCLFILVIITLFFQPAASFLPGALAQEGGDEPLAPNYPIHYVKPTPTGTGDCSSWANACGLQTALGAAVSGDEIWVQQGTYKPEYWANLTDFTFVAWVYFRGGSAWQRIFDFGWDTNNYMMLTPKDSLGRINYGIKVGGIEQTIASVSSLPENSWRHLALTRSGNTITIYVNGAQVASGNTTFSSSQVTNGDNLWLGRSQYAVDPYFNGNIDEVAIFNRALSQGDINVLAVMGWDATPGKVLALHPGGEPGQEWHYPVR